MKEESFKRTYRVAITRLGNYGNEKEEKEEEQMPQVSYRQQP